MRSAESNDPPPGAPGHRHAPGLGLLSMLAASVCFTTMGAFLKTALTTIPVFEAVFARSLVSVVILAGIIRQRKLSFRGHARGFLLSRSLFGFVAMCCGFYALGHLPLGDATLLHHTAPIFVAVFSVAFIGEKPGRGFVPILLTAAVGAALVIKPEGHFLSQAGLVGLLGGALAGAAYVHVRHLHRTDHTWVIAFHFTSISSLGAFCLMLPSFQLPDGLEIALLAGAGILGTGGQIFMTMAYRYDEASRLAPYAYSSVLLAVVYGLIFFQERPDVTTLAGMAMVVAAGILIYRQRRRLPGAEPTSAGV